MRGQVLLRQAIAALMVVLLGTESLVDAKDKSGVLKASELIGMKVEGSDGKNLGKIRDLVIDPQDGDIEYAVLDFGGFLGMGDKYFAVPWDALNKTENGKKIAHWLRNYSKVDKVYWPGFEDHPNHIIAKKQMRDFGGMLSFTLKDDSVENAMRVLSSTKLFSLAESLGGVESLINHPASMTHASIPRAERIKNGLSDSLIRLSVGIEDAEDLISDLEQALSPV